MLNPTMFDAVVADHRRDLEAQARTARLASRAPKAVRRGARPWLTSAIRLLRGARLDSVTVAPLTTGHSAPELVTHLSTTRSAT